MMLNKISPEELIGNKKIVEFMGCKCEIGYENYISNYIEYTVIGEIVNKWREKLYGVGGCGDRMMLSNTRFHNDYNWLMDVYRKVNDVIDVLVDSNTGIDYPISQIIMQDELLDGDLEGFYTYLVETIDFINENK